LVLLKDLGITRNGWKSTFSYFLRFFLLSADHPSCRAFGTGLKLLGIVDPDLARAQQQIDLKTGSGIAGYESALVWSTPEQATEALGSSTSIDLVIVGTPPHFRGCIAPPADLDVRLLTAFPQTKRWLVEKPVSAAPPSEVAGQREVARKYEETGAVVAAGYFCCSLQAVAKIQQVIQEKNLTVMGTAARFVSCFASSFLHTDERLCQLLHGVRVRSQGGLVEQEDFLRSCVFFFLLFPLLLDVPFSFPLSACLLPLSTRRLTYRSPAAIVEQATHLVNLSLLFGGKATLPSVRTQTVEHDEAPGKLSKLGFDEEGTVPADSRIPRYTSSIWKYASGAVGALTHVVGLHGNTYSTEFEGESFPFALSLALRSQILLFSSWEQLD
jgi:hypothetical protein